MIIQHEEGDTKGSFYIEDGDSRVAELTYSKRGSHKIIIDHTEVTEQLREKGVGKQLVMAAVEYARENDLKILPLCSFTKSVFEKVDEIRDVLS